MTRFIDTNIFIRYLARDDPRKAEVCLRLSEFEDALTGAHMEDNSIEKLISYDPDFDPLVGVPCIEPD